MAHPRSKQSKTRSRKRTTHYKLDTPNVMNCKNCGAPVEILAKVCEYCNKPIESKENIDLEICSLGDNAYESGDFDEAL